MFISARFLNKHGHHRQFLFRIGRFLKNLPSLKPLGQMNRNVAGSIYGRSSTKIAHFVPIRLQAWPPQAILVSEWSISKKKNPLWNACSSKQNERCTTAQPTEPFIVMLYSSHNKNSKIYWSKQSFTGLQPEGRCSSWGLFLFQTKVQDLSLQK